MSSWWYQELAFKLFKQQKCILNCFIVCLGHFPLKILVAKPMGCSLFSKQWDTDFKSLEELKVFIILAQVQCVVKTHLHDVVDMSELCLSCIQSVA